MNSGAEKHLRIKSLNSKQKMRAETWLFPKRFINHCQYYLHKSNARVEVALEKADTNENSYTE